MHSDINKLMEKVLPYGGMPITNVERVTGLENHPLATVIGVIDSDN